MHLTLTPKRPRELYPTDILFQSRYWGEVKSRLGWRTYAFELDGAPAARDMLVIVKPFGPNGVAAYVPQGPEFAPPQEEYGPFLERLSESVVEQIDADLTFIRYDLPWESPYAAEMHAQHWVDFPESRIREMRMNFGTERWNLRKAPVDVTVANSFVVDLDGDEAHLLGRMKAKTRYNIRLAEKKDIISGWRSPRRSSCPSSTGCTCRPPSATALPSSDYRYFSALFDADRSLPTDPEVVLLLARHQGDPPGRGDGVTTEQGALFLHGAGQPPPGTHGPLRPALAGHALRPVP